MPRRDAHATDKARKVLDPAIARIVEALARSAARREYELATAIAPSEPAQ